MRGIFFIVFGLGLLLMVSGCSPKVATGTTSEVTDSTTTRYVPRIDTLYLPGEKVTLPPVYIECDSITNKPIPKKISGSNGRAHVGVVIDATGKLTATGSCDELKKIVQLMDKEIYRLRHEKKIIVPPPVIVYKTHWYDVPSRFISIITLIVLVVYIYFKIK